MIITVTIKCLDSLSSIGTEPEVYIGKTFAMSSALLLGEIQLLYGTETLDKVVKIGFDREVTKVGNTDSSDVIAASTWRLASGTTASTTLAHERRHVFVGWGSF